MNNQKANIIKNWIPNESKVIDFGCGDGSLLKNLIDQKGVHGYGVEIDHSKIQECVHKGISIVEKDIDEGIEDFKSSNFDVAIMVSSIQCLKEPHIALRKMLNLSKQCIVTLPNLGFWKCRIDLALGKMPVTPNLPSSWYETKNLHLCTIKDFEGLCESEGFLINERFYLNDKGGKNILSSAMPNSFASEGVYLLARK